MPNRFQRKQHNAWAHKHARRYQSMQFQRQRAWNGVIGGLSMPVVMMTIGCVYAQFAVASAALWYCDAV